MKKLFMIVFIIAAFMLVSLSNVQAILIDNGFFTTDEDSGLDWC